MQTDFPEPVAPAIRRCGIDARSSISGSPATSAPMKIGIASWFRSKSSDWISAFSLTSSRTGFGTSTPMVDFPGSGETIRTAGAFNATARSSARLWIRLTFTPAARSSSKSVTTGPWR